MVDCLIDNTLPLSVLGRISELPTKPAPVTLKGKCVDLVPLDLARDTESLFAVSNGSAIMLEDRTIDADNPDQHIWQYMSACPFESVHELTAFLRPQVEAENGLCSACLIAIHTGRLALLII